MEPRKKLADILHLGPGSENLEQAWAKTEAAADFTPLPGGEYPCRILSGEPFNAKKGTPGYKLTFTVTEGEFADRRIWHDLWLTAQALPMAKRDLAKLGVTQLEQLDRPLPVGILVRVKLSLRKDDNGNEYNQVRSFEVTGIEKGDAYAPSEDTADHVAFDPVGVEKEAAGQPATPSRDQEPPDLFNMTATDDAGPYRGERR